MESAKQTSSMPFIISALPRDILPSQTFRMCIMEEWVSGLPEGLI
jgi:hypothetical protein